MFNEVAPFTVVWLESIMVGHDTVRWEGKDGRSEGPSGLVPGAG